MYWGCWSSAVAASLIPTCGPFAACHPLFPSQGDTKRQHPATACCSPYCHQTRDTEVSTAIPSHYTNLCFWSKGWNYYFNALSPHKISDYVLLFHCFIIWNSNNQAALTKNNRCTNIGINGCMTQNLQLVFNKCLNSQIRALLPGRSCFSFFSAPLPLPPIWV